MGGGLPLWPGSRRSDGLFPESLATPIVSSKNPTKTACWNIRATQNRPAGEGWMSRPFCSPETTRRLPPGATNNSVCALVTGGRNCSQGCPGRQAVTAITTPEVYGVGGLFRAVNVPGPRLASPYRPPTPAPCGECTLNRNAVGGLLPARGEYDRAVVGDRGGVFGVRSEWAIRAAEGPTIGISDDLVGCCEEPRFNRDDQARLQREAAPGAAIVGDRGVAVHCATDTVPAEVGVNGVAGLVRDIPNCGGDIADAIADAGSVDARGEGALGGVDEVQVFYPGRADDERDR